MEFNEKLQELRKQKNMTQEEVASSLFVSRTAVSKWESGRGYPSIESLKQISALFSISIDELLSSDELLNLAEEDKKQNNMHFSDLVFGFLDFFLIVLFFLPFFAQNKAGVVEAVSLIGLTETALYVKVIFIVIIILTFIFGILTLALQNCSQAFWVKNKYKISVFLNIICLLIFILCGMPYATIFLLIFMFLKIFVLLKNK